MDGLHDNYMRLYASWQVHGSKAPFSYFMYMQLVILEEVMMNLQGRVLC